MERLYYNDSYLVEFEAVIEKCVPTDDNIALLLSRTAFYPESGGQPSDRGWIDDIPVLEVTDSDEGPLHLVASSNFSAGRKVKGKIEWNRRFDHMQHHTGQHILSRAFLEILDAETISFHLGTNDVTIDIDREKISDPDLEKVEERANQAITENLQVRTYNIDSSDQSKIPVRKPSAREEDIRIVEVEGWDYSPCGGTHCSSTGEVGLIKILSLERVRRKLRVHFLCGHRALADYAKKTRLVREMAQTLTCGEEDLAENLRSSLETGKSEARHRRKLQEKLIELLGRHLSGHCVRELGGHRVVAETLEDLEIKDLNKLASSILQSGNAEFVMLAAEKPRPGIVLARTDNDELPDLRTILREIQDLFDGKGGGSADRVQAGGNDPKGVRPALETALELLTGPASVIG